MRNKCSQNWWRDAVLSWDFDWMAQCVASATPPISVQSDSPTWVRNLRQYENHRPNSSYGLQIARWHACSQLYPWVPLTQMADFWQPQWLECWSTGPWCNYVLPLVVYMVYTWYILEVFYFQFCWQAIQQDQVLCCTIGLSWCGFLFVRF